LFNPAAKLNFLVGISKKNKKYFMVKLNQYIKNGAAIIARRQRRRLFHEVVSKKNGGAL